MVLSVIAAPPSTAGAVSPKMFYMYSFSVGFYRYSTNETHSFEIWKAEEIYQEAN